MPVNVSSELLVCVQPRPVLDLVSVFSIDRRRGPVHETMRLIGGVVAHVNADVLRNLSGDRRIFLRRDRTRERHNQAKTRRLWPMAMSAVKNGRAAENQNNRVPRVRISRHVVKV